MLYYSPDCFIHLTITAGGALGKSPNCLPPITAHRVPSFPNSPTMDSDDDELQRAIRLSLQPTESAPPKRSVDIVDLTEDNVSAVWPGFDGTDDMDFWKAIAVSMGEGA